MYNHIYSEKVDAAGAERLPTPIWMDHHGEECQKNDALGCLVTDRLNHSELCFVGDKVGGNTSMKGDGNARGKKGLHQNKA